VNERAIYDSGDTGELMELMKELPLIGLGKSELERLVRG